MIALIKMMNLVTSCTILRKTKKKQFLLLNKSINLNITILIEKLL